MTLRDKIKGIAAQWDQAENPIYDTLADSILALVEDENAKLREALNMIKIETSSSIIWDLANDALGGSQ